MSNWQDMFEPRRPESPVATTPQEIAHDPADETAPAPDPRAYHPWIIQRGRSRPAMLLDFRQFEPKSGLLIGCQMPYHHLAGIEYLGDRMVTLDFGLRQFVIEGAGLDELARHLQQGTVLAIQQYSERVWPQAQHSPIITRVVKVDGRRIDGTTSR